MVEVSFYVLSIISIGMLLLLFRNYPFNQKIIGGFAVLWVTYLIFLAQTGILKSFDIPPRIPLLVVIPIFLTIIILVSRKFMRTALEEIPFHIPIAMQSFRIFVELLIFATYLKGVFPQRATFEGLNFDILVGISAIFISVAAFKGFIKNRGILIWNLISLSILSLTVYSFISTYYFSDFGVSVSRFKFVEFPYLLLASVLLPTAIFLHAFSIKQVLIRKLMLKTQIKI